MYKIVGYEEGNREHKISIEVFRTEANAMKFCECMNWIYNDGCKEYAMDIEREEN